jgi:hypothetical protein
VLRLAPVLIIPGLPRLLRVDAKSLDFIQTAQFDTAATEALAQRHGLTWPDMTEALRVTARYLAAAPLAAEVCVPGRSQWLALNRLAKRRVYPAF